MDRETFTLMGINIGKCDSWENLDDNIINITRFEPDSEVCKVPGGDVELNLLEGTWRSFDHEGKMFSNGLIFEQLS